MSLSIRAVLEDEQAEADAAAENAPAEAVVFSTEDAAVAEEPTAE